MVTFLRHRLTVVRLLVRAKIDVKRIRFDHAGCQHGATIFKDNTRDSISFTSLPRKARESKEKKKIILKNFHCNYSKVGSERESSRGEFPEKVE